MSDEQLLKKAIEVGDEVEAPFNFGAVVADANGKIISADHGYVFENHDPSAHAEVTAIKNAGKALNTQDLKGCILYASHEPCSMCVSCAVWAGIDRIVFNKLASEQDPGMYRINNYSASDYAKNFLVPIKVTRLDLRLGDQ
ncbi:MAG TPA: nucleoside deaminase [Candidatus Saccharimonadales bacterium]|nr:nucleoside deaminase [Candidatus Saccharimonadales bacterium]